MGCYGMRWLLWVAGAVKSLHKDQQFFVGPKNMVRFPKHQQTLLSQ